MGNTSSTTHIVYLLHFAAKSYFTDLTMMSGSTEAMIERIPVASIEVPKAALTAR